MVRDRFNEFQQRSATNDNTWAINLDDNIEGRMVSSQTPSTNYNSAPDELNASRLAHVTAHRSQNFLSHVNELRESIDRLRQRIEALQQRQAAVLSQTVVRPEHKDQLSALIDEIKDHTHSLRPRVRQIELDLRRDEAAAGASAEIRTGAELRIRRNQCEMLKLRLNDLLSLFNQTQDEYKSRVSRRVKRQLDLVGEHLSGAQVDQMLESKSHEVFYRQMTPASFAAQSALDDATNRHNEILNLEQSITELHDVFRDIYELVHSQNSAVDHIATNVESAGEFVRDAHIQVTRAVTYKKSARRRKCILTLAAITVGLIMLVIVIILISSILPSAAKA